MRVTGKISADVLESYGPADRTRADALLQKEVAENRRKIIVLDDDPTVCRLFMTFQFTRVGTGKVSERALRKQTVCFMC